MKEIHALLQQAVALHQKGELAAAQAIYDEVLRAQPLNFDALHLSGALARQQGEPQRALDLIDGALAIDSRRAIAHCNRGVALQDLARYDEALASFERALALQPGYAIALSNRGNALRHLGHLERALESFDAALRLSPKYADALCNRALTLQSLARHEAALDTFGAALQARPEYPEALHGAAISLLALGQPADALEGFERALHIQPEYAEAWCSRGALLLRAQDHEEALSSFQDALTARPRYARAQLGLANTLRAMGRREEAVAAYQAALAFGAEADTVGYMLAIMGAEQAPGASPAGYVKALFDQYAGNFDRHLVDVLRYRTPSLLVEALRRHLPAGELDMLDAGCGTGLCGPLLRPLACLLEGVDLSSHMLDRARDTGLYDGLYCGEMVAYLRARPASVDVIVAADVFVYLGDLKPVFSVARLALRSGGRLAFSVERHDGAEDFALRSSGRYAHSRTGIEALARSLGFTIHEITPSTLRQESGEDMPGLLVILSTP
ncbi:Predicted methyltransferase, contains TPR repeat [Duganella sp. CF458]|uniref:tetratricopeptide repeat protein n=1 Tax=Duganella sp. CF458 TaxID=1884368 RepID=UPI0008E3A719|nr:tetratricopeptide repeat protein [Duganella sp. CF458]SFG18702.1 Predicted methyltransferase, contains TPR repeat [Duganella sp. CF458]